MNQPHDTTSSTGSQSSLAVSPEPDGGQALELARLLEETVTESGRSFISLVEESPVLLVFLRHAGCTFCREALGDISRDRSEIEASGARIVLVHMGDRAEIQQVIAKYNLSDLERICDRDQNFYRAFGLKQGNLRQLFGFKVWWREVAALWNGHGWGRPAADPTQMPGVFLVDQGMIANRFRHRSAADKPSYVALAQTGAGQSETRR